MFWSPSCFSRAGLGKLNAEQVHSWSKTTTLGQYNAWVSALIRNRQTTLAIFDVKSWRLHTRLETSGHDRACLHKTSDAGVKRRSASRTSSSVLKICHFRAATFQILLATLLCSSALYSRHHVQDSCSCSRPSYSCPSLPGTAFTCVLGTFRPFCPGLERLQLHCRDSTSDLGDMP